MKSKTFLLPRMAVNNIRKNRATYLPYIGVSIFAMFTYFAFDLILQNDIMRTLPKAAYAVALVSIGFVLLGVIMVPFLYYTNSFLIKRRKKELGLYSILGLEKKHIGVMMLWESLIVYGIVMTAAIALGLLFAKLIFLLLLNLAKMPVDVALTVRPKVITDSLLFYAFVTGLNLFVNFVQVGKARPAELMSDTKRGEKEPRHIAVWTVLGVLTLGYGYYLALSSKLDNSIFTDFFLAIFLVVVGTYFLFTSGSIALLRLLKRNKKYYYRADNFVTVSGMLYRMKKNAASLSNICIFGTMVIITVICTLSIWLCEESITRLSYPWDFAVTFLGGQEESALQEELMALAQEEGVTITDYLGQEAVPVSAYQEGSLFREVRDGDRYDYTNRHAVALMTLEAYNRMEGEDKSLEEGEALLFTTGTDFGLDTIRLGTLEFRIKEELAECGVGRKVEGNSFGQDYVLVLPGWEAVKAAASVFGTDADSGLVFRMSFTPEGTEEAVDAFSEEAALLFGEKERFAGFRDYREDISEQEGMYGGLLFIGIFFGTVFLICLLVIMYYKQITEGFEDQKNFEIMQKVGMSDEEIRRTIKKQIRLVFTLPLAGAVLHTIVGMKMVIVLMSAINCFETGAMLGCTAAVCLVFAAFYCVCYKRTSVIYYHIVSRMN